MSAIEAKSQLLDLGRRRSPSASVLGNPVVRAGALLVAGALLGRMIRQRGTLRTAGSLREVVLRTGLTAAPLLVEQFIRGVSRRAVRHDGRVSEHAAAAPARA